MSTTAPTADPAPAEPGEADEPTSSRPGPTFEAIAVIALLVAFAAIVVAVFAMGLAARSIDEHRAVADGAGSGSGGPVAVSLTEFAISPAPLSASVGGTLAVTNDGATTHDLTVEDQDLATATLNAGDAEQLALGDLAAGTYSVFCSIPGHRESGMETSLTLG